MELYLPEMIPGIGWVYPDHPLHPDHEKAKALSNEVQEEEVEA